MKTNFNIELINKDILRIYVVPYEESPKLNLTWSIKSFEGNSLVINLQFEHPLEVSKGLKYDELVVHF